MEEIIVLNSGGFDSVVLIHDLVKGFNRDKIVSLFFDYGQRNLELEREKARKVADKFNLEHKEIELPAIDWSKSTLYSENGDEVDNKSQYIEMRNLIFFSYAFSLAESRGISDVHSAILKSTSEEGYNDTSLEFIEKVKELASTFGVNFYTFYNESTKDDIAYLARRYNIERDDFYTCNFPNDKGEPCGECGDCKALERIYKNTIEDWNPQLAWFSNDLAYSEKFEKLFKENNIHEARILNNNKCQFDCKHCFYGFDETISPNLSLEEWKEVLDQLVEEGVQNFHFSGKEPLFDRSIFKLFEHLQSKENITYDLVTNGVNVKPFIDDLVKYGVNKVFVSVDSFSPEIRNEDSFEGIAEALHALRKTDIDVEVFIDTHKDNKNEVKDIVRILHVNYGVERFHVRTISPLGHAKDIKDKIVSAEEYAKVFEDLIEIDYPVTIEFALKMEYTEYIMSNFDENRLLNQYIQSLVTYGYNILSNEDRESLLLVQPEFYCGRYESQVTVTSDGYMLGCGTEVSNPRYDKLAVGNVRDAEVSDLIAQGKEESLALIKRREEMTCKTEHKCSYCTGSCYHTFNCLF